MSPGMLRFWGLSYGTALGATAAAMFPDQMDKVVLDGVLNMDQYYAGKEIQQVVDADSTWAGFFSGCVDAPDLCVLAHDGSSADELQDKAEGLLQTVKFAPITLGLNIVNYSILKALIFTGLYVYPRDLITSDFYRASFFVSNAANGSLDTFFLALSDADERLRGVLEHRYRHHIAFVSVCTTLVVLGLLLTTLLFSGITLPIGLL